MKNIIADRCSLIDASGIRKVFALAAKLDDPVNFSIGQPDFDIPSQLKQAAIDAIRGNINSYSQTAGDELLKEKIAAKTAADTGWDDPKVLVTSGVSGGLLTLFMAIINPGDEVIIPDPYFVIYKHVINMLGGKCVFVDSYPDFELPIDGIEKAITKKTKLIVANSPCNPTGMVYCSKTTKRLAEVARKHDLLVMSDEIYDKFSYDQPCESIAKHYENTIILNGFSKAYAMTGWRLGYAVVHDSNKEIIEQMMKIQQYTFVCAPTPFQQAAIAAMDHDISEHVDQYKQKRDLIYDGLKGKFEMVKPAGAFYAFVKAPGGNATEFVKKAINNSLLIIPGNVFSEKNTHFRISYATTNDEIARGIEILNSIAE